MPSLKTAVKDDHQTLRMEVGSDHLKLLLLRKRYHLQNHLSQQYYYIKTTQK